MQTIEPDMVLGKEAVNGTGDPLGEIVDVGLYTHRFVKFIVVQDRTRKLPARRVGVDAITDVLTDVVKLRLTD